MKCSSSEQCLGGSKGGYILLGLAHHNPEVKQNPRQQISINLHQNLVDAPSMSMSLTIGLETSVALALVSLVIAVSKATKTADSSPFATIISTRYL